MPAPRLLRRDWQKDHVYLVQFPRAGCIPSASPFSLKLESWLRLVDIPYSNVSNNFKTKSARGQIPFIELNGRQVADSNDCIEHLKQEFKKDPEANFTADQLAHYKAYHSLIEDKIFWAIPYTRGRDNKWFMTDKGFGKHFRGVKLFLFKNLIAGQMAKKIKSKTQAQGIGRLNQIEMENVTKEGFDSLEAFLGNKAFFFGNSPTTLDVTAFGHIMQFLYTPQLSNELKNHLEQNCPNLTRMVNRIKTEYWPDWDEACEKLSLDTQWKKTTQ